MTKDPDEKKSLEEKVNEWLSQQGYRLEYLAWKAFTDVGLVSVMSAFVESKEGKPREIDVTGMYQMENEPIVVRVMCECKYSNQPWVLLYSTLAADLKADWFCLPHSESIKALWSYVQQEEPYLKSLWHFSPKTRFAHTIVEALKKDNRDFAYDSLQKITNAAWTFAESRVRQVPEFFMMVFPCIIVDAPLLAATFDYEKGQFESYPVPFGRLSWSGCRGGTVVDIVQANSLPDYAKVLQHTMETVSEVIWASRDQLTKK